MERLIFQMQAQMKGNSTNIAASTVAGTDYLNEEDAVNLTHGGSNEDIDDSAIGLGATIGTKIQKDEQVMNSLTSLRNRNVNGSNS